MATIRPINPKYLADPAKSEADNKATALLALGYLQEIKSDASVKDENLRQELLQSRARDISAALQRSGLQDAADTINRFSKGEMNLAQATTRIATAPVKPSGSVVDQAMGALGSALASNETQNRMIVGQLITDPKIMEAVVARFPEIQKDTGVNPHTLPEQKKKYIMEDVVGKKLDDPKKQAEIAEIYRTKGEEAAKKAVIEVYVQGIKEGIKSPINQHKADPSSPTSKADPEQGRFNAGVQAGLNSGGIDGAVQAALVRMPDVVGARMPSQAEVESRVNAAQQQMAAAQMAKLRGGQAQITNPADLYNNGIMQSAIVDALNPKDKVFLTGLQKGGEHAKDSAKFIMDKGRDAFVQHPKAGEALEKFNAADINGAKKIIADVAAPAVHKAITEVKPEQSKQEAPKKSLAEMNPDERKAAVDAAYKDYADKEIAAGRKPIVLPGMGAPSR